MKVLFICKANVGRSQIATAFFNQLSKTHTAFSAGTNVNENNKPLFNQVTKEGELSVKCMAGAGIDLSKTTRKQLTPEMVKEADKIIVMTEKENWPEYLRNSPKVIIWQVEDAKGMSYEFHCRIRDQIKKLVEELVKEIG